jgi:muconolactone delta-isomerase
MPAGEDKRERRFGAMRVFVLVEPKFFIPPEMFPALLEVFAAWREAHRESMEAFEFFAGGGGGFGIFNVPDEATLNRIMVQYPFTPFSDITIRPILDGDTALGQWREIMSQIMSAGPSGEPSH